MLLLWGRHAKRWCEKGLDKRTDWLICAGPDSITAEWQSYINTKNEAARYPATSRSAAQSHSYQATSPFPSGKIFRANNNNLTVLLNFLNPWETQYKG